MAQEHELMTVALQQRIGEIVSDYEGRIAATRASFTIQLQELQEQVRKLNAQIEARDKDEETVELDSGKN